MGKAEEVRIGRLTAVEPSPPRRHRDRAMLRSPRMMGERPILPKRGQRRSPRHPPFE
jgi:hypothetical protein